jgi:two-component system, OmpR family, sensor histidine kinase KdpD
MPETPEQSVQQTSPQKKQGTFKLFLGYAPGVGETYSMLAEAIRRKSRGEDVVVGVVESHGRQGIIDLSSKLEAVPRRQTEYKGTLYEEMDVDAILAYRPQVVLVDELAHTNAHGSKHPKRYEDVVDLLDAKVDVLSTLNIQHIESLAPLVQRITGVQIRELVPDRMLQRVDEIVLADLTPEALQNRMRRGDIYPLDRTESALGHFFQPGNLIALRELTLLQVAGAVGRSRESQSREGESARNPGVRQRIAACIKSTPSAPYVIARAFRLAKSLDAELYVVYVDNGEDLTPGGQRTLDQSLQLAENLGAQVLRVKGKHVAREITQVVRENHINQVVFGHSAQTGWRKHLYFSAIHTFLRDAFPVDVHIITQK